MALNKFRRRLKHTSYQVQQLEMKNGLAERFYTFQDAGLYFIDIIKDAIDTFKPYKTNRHFDRDLYQIFYGASNFVKGFLSVLSELMLMVRLVFEIFSKNTPERFETMARNIVGGLAQMLRGAIQIVTSPLTLLRMPFRYFYFKGIQDEKFQDRKSIKQLVDEADELLSTPLLTPNNEAIVDQMRFILDELQRKAITQRESKKQNCYKGKEVISIGKSGWGGVNEFYTADHYLSKESVEITPQAADEIKKRLSSFRAG